MDGVPKSATPRRTASRIKVKTPARTKVRRRRGHSLSLLEDIGTLIARSHDLQETLQDITKTIAERMNTDVCSLYMLDPQDTRLTLWATTGLDRSAVGKVSMSTKEGLCGLVIEKMEPVADSDAMLHPRNKYFPETGEERFHSFLGVPVVEKHEPLGVLVIQSLSRRRFSLTDIRLLKTISANVSGIIVQARLLETLKTKEQEREEYRKRMLEAVKRLSVYEPEREEKPAVGGKAGRTRLTGVSASPGFGIGQARPVHPSIHLSTLAERQSADPEREIQHLHRAVKQSIEELELLKERVKEQLPELDRAIFDAHRMMIEDPGFLEKIENSIRQGYAAETSLKKVVDEYADALSKAANEYLRARNADIRDIGQRLLRHLLGLSEKEHAHGESLVLVAEELTLSDLCLVDHTQVKGVVMSSGGATSHASILAKSFEIPVVVGVEHADLIRQDDVVIVDGNSGVVYVNPGAEILHEYDRLDRKYRDFNRDLEDIRDLPAETRDGKRVALCANVGLLIDLTLARRHGAEGVGLYRTEIPFLTYRDFPGEEEQLDLYRRVITGINGHPVTIRTLDLGPDKYPSHLRLPREDNPFLGWRSIRISLEMEEMFKIQLRAIFRAGALGPVRILFPMISSVEEIRQVKELLAQVRDDLRREGLAFDPDMRIGMMVEAPAAVWLADRFIKEVDFFSIGTNDLIQYVLAVDRNNRKVAALYDPLHPAVLTAVARTTAAAKAAGKRTSMCGEMAADPLCTILLLGLGLDELSMEPFFVPVIKRVIRSLSYARTQRLAQEALGMETVQDVKRLLFEELKQLDMMELVEMYH
ncbi:MAG: phosphoenolpyruvate--protein phosphotransferase [Deltaproteobacteria bacterium]|nr:phosphoenolpyruvate--protein phosphotransferase [Deltaproteobacteria bacterium]